MKKIALTTILATVLLTACGEKIHDTEYWKAHPQERETKWQECQKNPAKADTDGNCINIREILRIEYLEQQKQAIQGRYDELLEKDKVK